MDVLNKIFKDKLVKDNYFTNKSFDESVDKYFAKNGSAINSGVKGEQLLCGYIRTVLPNCKIARNVYLLDETYEYTKPQYYSECDIIIVTSAGLHLLECKNFNGTIDGKVTDSKLKVTYANGKGFELYNPIMQVNRHKDALLRFLDDITVYNKIPIYTYVVFSDYAELKISGSPNIFVGNQVDFIKSIVDFHKSASDCISPAQQKYIFDNLTKYSDLTKNMKFIHTFVLNGCIVKD